MSFIGKGRLIMRKHKRPYRLGKKRKFSRLTIVQKWIINFIWKEHNQSIWDFIKDLIDDLQDWFDDP